MKMSDNSNMLIYYMYLYSGGKQAYDLLHYMDMF